jgi:hypothetical protein
MKRNMIVVSLKTRLSGVVAVVACVVGIAAPAFAASRDVLIDNKLDGWESPRWNDGAGASPTEVRARWCSLEFQATIRKDRTGLPDPNVGQEWLNCASYVDSVYSDGDTATGDYHYDINGMDGSCFCDYRTTADTSVYW